MKTGEVGRRVKGTTNGNPEHESYIRKVPKCQNEHAYHIDQCTRCGVLDYEESVKQPELTVESGTVALCSCKFQHEIDPTKDKYKQHQVWVEMNCPGEIQGSMHEATRQAKPAGISIPKEEVTAYIDIMHEDCV